MEKTTSKGDNGHQPVKTRFSQQCVPAAEENSRKRPEGKSASTDLGDVFVRHHCNGDSIFGSYRRSIKQRLRRLSSYTGRVTKPAHEYIRWYLLFTALIIFSISSPFWINCVPVIGDYSMHIFLLVLAILHLLWLIAVFNAVRLLIRLRRYAQHVIRLSEFPKKAKHIVGIPMYREPLELMTETLDSIAVQPDARQKITVFVALEEGTPNRETKMRHLKTMYDSKFEHFMVTVHKKNIPGDIPGKCSNFNYGSRTAIKQLRADPSYGLDSNDKEVFVTTADCDTIFGERYFDALEEDYWKLHEKQRYRTVWQSPLFYCISIDRSPFFVHITGLLRAFFMMGYLIPWNINTMSVFSLTLKLFEEGEYTHPGYQMDDIIALIRWTCAVQQKCIIRAIPVTTLSGPTSGNSYLDELYEWARQIRRWTIGAAEVFHYFVIKSKCLPITVSITWALRFIFYYGYLLCIASIYCIIAPITVMLMTRRSSSKVEYTFLSLNYTLFGYFVWGSLALQYFWFLCVFTVNRLAQPVFPDGVRDRTGCIRNFLHYVMTWPTLVAYCVVEVFAFLEVTVRGKSVCSHSASKKDALVPKSASVGRV